MTEYLTTKEAAALLRLKERKIYDLAARGALPCSRATGKLLFPRSEIEAWLAASTRGPMTAATASVAAADRPAVMLGSSDPLLEWVVRQSGCGLATLLDGSLDGLQRFGANQGVACGLHVWDAGAENWNVAAVAERFDGQPVVLIEWCWRQRGLIVAPDKAGRFAGGLKDLAGKSLAQRQHGSGSQMLLAALLARDGPALDAIDCLPAQRTESDAALMVREGKADAAFGLAAFAAQYRLDFVPVVRERFDLLVDRRAYFDEPLQALWRFCRSDAFAARARELAGYDVTGLGTVRYVG